MLEKNLTIQKHNEALTEKYTQEKTATRGVVPEGTSPPCASGAKGNPPPRAST